MTKTKTLRVSGFRERARRIVRFDGLGRVEPRSHGRARATRIVERAIATMRAVVGVRVATAASPAPVARAASAEIVSRREASLGNLASVSRHVGGAGGRARGLVIVAARKKNKRAPSRSKGDGRATDLAPASVMVRGAPRASPSRGRHRGPEVASSGVFIPGRLPSPAAYAPTPPTMFPTTLSPY